MRVNSFFLEEELLLFWGKTHVNYHKHAEKCHVLARFEALPLTLAEAISYPIVYVANMVLNLAFCVFNLIGAAFSKNCSLKDAGYEFKAFLFFSMRTILSPIVCVATLVRGVYTKLISPQTANSFFHNSAFTETVEKRLSITNQKIQELLKSSKSLGSKQLAEILIKLDGMIIRDTWVRDSNNSIKVAFDAVVKSRTDLAIQMNILIMEEGANSISVFIQQLQSNPERFSLQFLKEQRAHLDGIKEEAKCVDDIGSPLLTEAYNLIVKRSDELSRLIGDWEAKQNATLAPVQESAAM